jgi:hypothetical protein
MGELFNDFVGPGLPSFDDFPTFAGITQLNQIVIWLISTNEASFVINNGCTTIYEGIQNYLLTKGNLILVNTTISQVIRPLKKRSSSNRNIIKGSNSFTNQSFVFACHDIIAAFPQTKKNMKFMGLDFMESRVFDHVFGYQYFNGVIHVNFSNGTDAFNINNRDGNKLICQGDRPGLSNLQNHGFGTPASYGFSAEVNKYLTPEEALHIINRDLSHIPSSIFQGNVIIDTGHSTTHNGFRPIFDRKTLLRKPNGYTLLKKLQGHRHTYYTGQLLTTAASFSVWNQALQLVQKHFPSKKNFTT